jgi:hypothetical protein
MLKNGTMKTSVFSRYIGLGNGRLHKYISQNKGRALEKPCLK